MTSLICEPQSLPHPPDHLLQDVLDRAHQGRVTQIQRQVEKFAATPEIFKRTVTTNGQSAVSRVQLRYHVPDPLIAWAAQYLPAGLTDFNMTISDGSNVHGPHVDYNRHFSLFYLLHGNNAATNSWWQKKGFDIEFKQDQWPSAVSDYEDLILIRRMTILPRTWYIFNTWIYHSVENLLGPRIAIQGDYMEFPH